MPGHPDGLWCYGCATSNILDDMRPGREGQGLPHCKHPYNEQENEEQLSRLVSLGDAPEVEWR